jgi:hypothetical protein
MKKMVVKPVLRGHLLEIGKGGLLRQVTSYKRLNSYKIFYDRTRKR